MRGTTGQQLGEDKREFFKNPGMNYTKVIYGNNHCECPYQAEEGMNYRMSHLPPGPDKRQFLSPFRPVASHQWKNTEEAVNKECMECCQLFLSKHCVWVKHENCDQRPALLRYALTTRVYISLAECAAKTWTFNQKVNKLYWTMLTAINQTFQSPLNSYIEK